MKKIINYLKRYYECTYKFDLYREYFKEPKILAFLFIVPILILFTVQTYYGSIETPNFVAGSFDPYYDLITNSTYEDVIDFEVLEEDEESPWTVESTDAINVAFIDSKVVLEQEKPLEKTIEKNGISYKVIIDTNRSYQLELDENNEYADEMKNELGFDENNMVTYVADSFVIMHIDGSIYSYDLTAFTTDYEDTESIYHFLTANYVNRGLIIQFSLISSIFLMTMYYFVVLFVMRSLLKRNNFTLSVDRKFKIIFYTMQPGLYVYLIVSFIMKQSNFALSFVVPTLAIITMLFINTKILDSVKDFIKKEQKAEKKLKHSKTNQAHNQ